MLVSIIIINYNTFELTCAAIQSVIEFSGGVTYEIVVVDNASVECDASRFAQKFPDIILVKSAKNLGFAKGNNLGLSHANGEYILLLNSDAALLNNAIEITLDILRHNEKIGVVTGKLTYPSGVVQPQCGRFPSIRLQLIELFRLQKLLPKEKQGKLLMGTFFNYASPVYPDWVWGTFFFVKREVILKMPEQKLPDDFFMYSEDLQWCYIVQKLGYRIYYEPKALVLHHFSQSTKKNKAIQQNQLILKNEDTFMRKNYGKLHTKAFYIIKALNLYILSFKVPANKALVHNYIKLIRGKHS